MSPQSNPKRLQAPIAKLNSNDRGSRTLGVVPRGPTYHSISTTSTKSFRLSLLHVARYGKRAARAPLGVGGEEGWKGAALRLRATRRMEPALRGQPVSMPVNCTYLIRR